MPDAALTEASIALVGAGEYLERCREVDEHLLGLLDLDGRTPRVTCLPTAAARDGEDVWRGWSRRGVEWFTHLGADAVAADVVDHPSANDPAMADAVARADLVYLSGGKPTLLHELLAGSAVWDAVLDVLGRGGILAGCSAGAMVQGGRVAGFRGGPGHDGFGLLPGTVVIPHFDEFPTMVAELLRRVTGRGHTVVGIDGGTGLVRHRGAFRAIGEGGVEVWGPQGHHRFASESIPADVLAPMP